MSDSNAGAYGSSHAVDIEKILGLIDEVASSQQGLADEEALILRG